MVSKEVSIADVAEIVIGGTPDTRIPEYWNGTIKWATAKDISSVSGKYLYDTEKSITELGLEKSSAKILGKDTIIISARGTVGKFCMLPYHMAFNQTCYGLIAKQKIINPHYLYYTLFCLREQINSLSYGTTFNTITKKTFQNIKFKLPPLPEQQKIASILSAFDDKIELNNEMNKTLEEIAQAIFKHWFIDFEFPNENGEPYKSNGGEFVDTELGPIPKGWEVVNLGDVLIEIESGTRPKGGVKEIKEGIPSVGAENVLGLGKYDYSKTKYIPYEFFNSMKKGIIKNGDVLLYKDGAQIGRKSYFDYNYPFEKCCVNEHVFILRVNESVITQLYLYFWLDQPFMTAKIIKLNANSAQPGINKQGVKSLPILIPKNEIVKKWDLIIRPLVKKIFMNSHEINVLSQLRDTLLPKLISSEIRVM